MKTILATLIFLLSMSPMLVQAQFTSTKIPTNAVKTTPVLSAPKLATTTKVDIGTLKNKTLENVISKTIPSVPSKEDLERSRIKSWEITPAKPVVTGMSIEVYGIYNKERFTILPYKVGTSDNRFFPNSNILTTSMATGKDYKLTLKIQNFLLATGKNVIVFDLGGSTTYEVDIRAGQKEVVLFFTNTIPSPQSIAWSPIIYDINNRPSPTAYDLVSVKLEELTPAN